MTHADFVNGLYTNVLARNPDAGGVSFWMSQLNAGASYDQVKAAFIGSAEAQTFVAPLVRLYEGLLNRVPDAGGLRFWADALRGGASLNSITDAFLYSPEAGANGFTGSLSNTAFVTKLYQSIGRTQAQIDADPAGVAYWMNVLTTVPRATVAQAFLESAENRQNAGDFVNGYLSLRAAGNTDPTTAEISAYSADVDFVERLYSNVLARDPDDGGVRAWMSHINAGASYDQVKAAFIGSPEAQTFVAPLVRLYEGLLNRAPDPGGLRFWADALRGGVSLNSITDAFLYSPEAGANGFTAGLSNQAFVTKLYQSIGRTQAQIDADPAGVAYWMNVLVAGTSRTTVAQAFLESAENRQDSNGFVLGWGALRAAGNPGPTTAQLDNFSDTATIGQIITSAATVGTSTTALPNGAGASPYNLSATAANLAAAGLRVLNAATDITATDAASVAQATIIEAATNAGTTTYSIIDTGAKLASAATAVLSGASVINTTDNAVILTGAQVTDAIVGKFHPSDDLTLKASGSVLAALTAATLGDADVVALDATDNTVTLTGARVTDAIVDKFDASDDLTLRASGATLATLSAVTLGDADVVALDATDNTLTLTDAKVTDAIVGKFDASDDLTLKASGATLAALPAATLGDADVVGLDATDNAVTLTGAQVTDAVVGKFHPSDDLTLKASGAVLAVLTTATLGDADVVALDATDNTVTLTGAKVTDAIVGKFDGSDDLTLKASGAVLAALTTATLGDADVVALDTTDNVVTLNDDQVTETILGKFDVSDRLTLAASGEELATLSAARLGAANIDFLDAWDDLITLTAAQYNALDAGNGLIEGNDFVTIRTDAGTGTLDLNGAGGAGMTVAFTQIGNVMTIGNFDDITDILQFSKLVFAAPSLPAAGVSIAANQLLSASDVTAAGGTDFAATHRFLYDTDSGNLFYDHNGIAGGAVPIATLTDAPWLTADNFFMIA